MGQPAKPKCPPLPRALAGLREVEKTTIKAMQQVGLAEAALQAALKVKKEAEKEIKDKQKALSAAIERRAKWKARLLAARQELLKAAHKQGDSLDKVDQELQRIDALGDH